MADDGNRFQEVGDSQAYIILEELLEDELVKPTEADDLKAKYVA